MSPIELLRCGALFTLITIGVGWPFVRRARLDPAEKFAATCIISLVIVWLVAWAIYVFALPLPIFWVLPVVAVANLAWGRAELLVAVRDSSARQIAVGYTLLSAWCVGWLAFVL